MNRILFITRNNPFIPMGGGNLATKAYLSALNTIFDGHIDVVLSAKYKDEILHSNNAYIKVPNRSKTKQIFGLLRGRLHRYNPYVKKFLEEKTHYDLCVFDGCIIAGDLVDYVKNKGIKTLTLHHNVESDFQKDSKTMITFKGFFPYFVIRNEKTAYLQSDINMFISRHDKDVYVSKYGNRENNCVIGVFETDKKKLTNPVNLQLQDNITIVLSGSLVTYQTEDAIVYFLSKLYPLIKEKYPSSTIIITGRSPSEKLINLCKTFQNIELIPNPVDIDNVIRRAQVYLSCTRLGSGLKLRLMDGLKHGLPILAHNISSQGYDSLVQYDWFQQFSNENEFINGLNKIISLLEKSKIEAQEIQNAYMNYFSFEKGVERIHLGLKNIL